MYNKLQSTFSSLVFALALGASLAWADDQEASSLEHYVIDTSGAHAFVQFKISHLGYSWLYGRFNDFEGTFNFDPEDPSRSSVAVTIETASIDSNHDRRDAHLKGDDFLAVETYPEASFVSTSFEPLGDGRYKMVGDFTLMGVTQSLEFDVEEIGTGEDPWGGYRRGFHGTTRFALADFGIDYNLGPASREVEIILDVEGVRQDPSS